MKFNFDDIRVGNYYKLTSTRDTRIRIIIIKSKQHVTVSTSSDTWNVGRNNTFEADFYYSELLHILWS